MASVVVQQSISQHAVALGQQLMRHGGNPVLVQDVLHSLGSWAARSYVRNVVTAIIGATVAPDELLDTSASLAGEQLDSALTTLRMLSNRLAALSSMAHEPHSTCSSNPGLTISAQSWLLPQRTANQHYWQYGYELRFTNSSEEPLQLLRKAWHITELSGVLRSRSSSGLWGMQPVIHSGESRAFKSATTLNSVKGSIKGQFMFKGPVTGSLFPATVAAFALTPTAQQYHDKLYMPADLLRPGEQQQQSAALADYAHVACRHQAQQQATTATAASAAWKCLMCYSSIQKGELGQI